MQNSDSDELAVEVNLDVSTSLTSRLYKEGFSADEEDGKRRNRRTKFKPRRVED